MVKYPCRKNVRNSSRSTFVPWGSKRGDGRGYNLYKLDKSYHQIVFGFYNKTVERMYIFTYVCTYMRDLRNVDHSILVLCYKRHIFCPLTRKKNILKDLLRLSFLISYPLCSNKIVNVRCDSSLAFFLNTFNREKKKSTCGTNILMP